MKSKFTGIVVVALFLLSAIAAIVMVPWSGEEARSEVEAELRMQEARVPQIQALDAGLMAEVDRLSMVLTDLAYPAKGGPITVDPRVLGFYPGPGVSVEHQVFSVPPEHFDQVVSMTFLGQSGRYCVINGKLYREGQLMEDGAQVAAVQRDRVLIRGRSMSQWVGVGQPLEGAEPQQAIAVVTRFESAPAAQGAQARQGAGESRGVPALMGTTPALAPGGQAVPGK